jgi:hypothetical protein
MGTLFVILRNVNTMNNIYFLILLALFSCSKEKKCNTEKEFFVDRIDAPLEGLINQNVHIETVITLSGCMSFKAFEAKGSGKDRTIVPVVNIDNCSICPAVIQEFSAIYSFVPKEKGIYTLRFKSGENTYLQTAINIE